jgi:uncharacterized protein (DUF305 family)
MLKRILIAAIFTALPAAAIAAETHTGHGAHGDAASAAFMAANDAMMKDMMVEPTGDADRDFIRMMIPHHQGAVAMAKVVLEYGKDADVKRLAEGIIKAQEEEIAWMQDWLAKHPAQ